MIRNSPQWSPYITADKCTKFINILSKSAKLQRRLKYGALRTINNWSNPIITLLYSICLEQDVQPEENRKSTVLRKHQDLQTFITKSSDAVCVLIGLSPLIIKLQKIIKNMISMWTHHYEVATSTRHSQDRSKSEDGFSSGIAMNKTIS